MKSVTSILSMATILAIGAAAQASLLVEETFDYAAGTLVGNNGGTGFSTAWATTFTSNAVGSIDVTSGSIAFSDYATTGNKVTVDLQNRTNTSSANILAERTVSAGLASGDMWVSYLYQRQDTTGSITSRTARVGFNDGAIHFDTAIKQSSSQGIAVRYDATNGATVADVSVQDGSAYLAIVKYADLGVVNSLASFWVLSAANYDSIKAGGIDESELDGAAVLKATDAVTSAEVLTAAVDLLRIVNVSSDFPFTFDVDEFRLGTSLSDVAAVPEPASAALAVFALSLLTIRRD
ncbi:MAG: hypothetical protein IT445_09040 [Phycisphaeraceae bacterium]|nr:hypothetical protein [Phycisphaeraceae bacterium]